MNKIMATPAKALQWCRIAYAVRRVKRCGKTDADERRRAQRVLANLIGESRGLAMKIGQLIAGNDESTPYRELVTGVEPLPLDKVMGVMEKQLQQPAMQVFKKIEESSAAASLGQVHHAVLNDGQEVAVKIRYPGIIDSIDAELRLSRWLPDAGPVKRWRFDSADYKNTLNRQLLRETDYSVELQTQRRFKQKFCVPGLIIPKAYSKLSSDGLLVQSWEEGCRLEDACHWPKKDRLFIARTLLMTLFQGLFVHGEVHGDPHPGNYLFRHDRQGHPETVLLDYGCTVLVSKDRRLALLKLLHAFQAGHDVDPLQGFSAMGFDAEKLGHIEEKMGALCHMLFRPFLVQRPFHTGQWQLSAALQELLEEQRWWFRAAGPADLLLLLRAFHGLAQQLERLDVAMPWWPLLKHTVGDSLLEQADNMEMPSAADIPKTRHRISARKLCVRVVENGVHTISLDLPAEAAVEMECIIPLRVLSQIKRVAAFDLSEISWRLQHEGVVPQALFNLDEGEKQCRVWLE